MNITAARKGPEVRRYDFYKTAMPALFDGLLYPAVMSGYSSVVGNRSRRIAAYSTAGMAGRVWENVMSQTSAPGHSHRRLF